MTYWTVLDARGGLLNAWNTESGIAIRAHNGQHILQTDCAMLPEALRKHAGEPFHPHRFEEAMLGPAEYHPRIHRQRLTSYVQELPDPAALTTREMAASLQSARNLFVQLREVFRYVEPSTANQCVYGDQLRSLLILSCTEVESAFRGVLIANNGATHEGRLNTGHYVKLAGPMRLIEWRVRLPGFPDYPVVTPFEGWDAAAPTQSLRWYEAYNEVKHDRAGRLASASLQNLLMATSGLYVILAAQFGVNALHYGNSVTHDLVVESTPNWPLAELYVPPLVNGGKGEWKARPLF